MRFVSGDQTLNSVAAFLSSEETEIALAVAFWGGDALKRLGIANWKAKKVRVICDAPSGACNPRTLKDLKDKIGDGLRANARLHAKVYWTPSKLIVTSANASASGLALQDKEVEGNIEAGVESTSGELLKAAKTWFDAVFNSNETVKIDDRIIEQAKQMWKNRRHGRRSVEQPDNVNLATPPAQFLAPVQQHWIDQAIDEFNRLDREKIYFGTNANIGRKPELVETVLFKPKGTNFVTAKAVFIDITDSPPEKDMRLEGEVEGQYEIYYGFKALEKLRNPIRLASLRYYTAETVVPNTVPGCCFVRS